MGYVVKRVGVMEFLDPQGRRTADERQASWYMRPSEAANRIKRQPEPALWEVVTFGTHTPARPGSSKGSLPSSLKGFGRAQSRSG